MGFQTSYASTPDAAKLGQLGDIGFNDIVSQYSAAIIPVGRVVCYDAAVDKVKLPAGTTDIADANTESRPVAGVAISELNIEEQDANVLGVAGANVPAYPIGRAFSVLRKGRVWVWSEQAVAPTDQVFVRFTAAGDEKVGNVRKDADAGKAVNLKGARFASVTTGAGLVLLELNLTN